MVFCLTVTREYSRGIKRNKKHNRMHCGWHQATQRRRLILTKNNWKVLSYFWGGFGDFEMASPPRFGIA